MSIPRYSESRFAFTAARFASRSSRRISSCISSQLFPSTIPRHTNTGSRPEGGKSALTLYPGRYT